MGSSLSSPIMLNKIMQNKEEEKESDFSMAESVYTPKTIFSSWLNLSFFSVTAAMIFYDMTRRKSLPAHPILVAMIAIGLILISVSYVYFGIYPYFKRMSIALDKCSSNSECSKQHLEDIKRLRNEFTLLGIGTIVIESLIAILIIWQTSKLL